MISTVGKVALTVAAMTILGAAPPSANSRSHLSDWGPPKNLGLAVNSVDNDFTPAISEDGLHLYFTSNRPGGFGLNDVWVSTRPTARDLWGVPVNLGLTVNSTVNDAVASLSRDGHYLFFSSNRTEGAFGSNDLWVSHRKHVHNDFDWEAPVNLGPVINGPSFDAGAALVGREFYFTSDRESGGGSLDIFLSLLGPRGIFGPATLVPELSGPGNDQRPSVRFDGLEIVFSSNRLGSVDGSQDIWVSTRRARGDIWSSPENLGPVINTSFQEQQPALSGDGTLLLFGSDRPEGSGVFDLWVSERHTRSH